MEPGQDQEEQDGRDQEKQAAQDEHQREMGRPESTPSEPVQSDVAERTADADDGGTTAPEPSEEGGEAGDDGDDAVVEETTEVEENATEEVSEPLESNSTD